MLAPCCQAECAELLVTGVRPGLGGVQEPRHRWFQADSQVSAFFSICCLCVRVLVCGLQIF